MNILENEIKRVMEFENRTVMLNKIERRVYQVIPGISL